MDNELLVAAIIIFLICSFLLLCSNRKNESLVETPQNTGGRREEISRHGTEGLQRGIATRSQGNLTCRRQVSEREDWVDLVQELVNKFKGFRLNTCEFAVLFRFPSASSRNWVSSVRRCTLEGQQANPYPHNGKRNFRVSRPTPSHHAEDLLLQNLEAFVRPRESDAIILYTWLEPCPPCVQRLVSALGRYTTTHRVVVLYTVQHYHNLEPLREAGIEVYRVPYNAPLPPP